MKLQRRIGFIILFFSLALLAIAGLSRPERITPVLTSLLMIGLDQSEPMTQEHAYVQGGKALRRLVDQSAT